MHFFYSNFEVNCIIIIIYEFKIKRFLFKSISKWCKINNYPRLYYILLDEEERGSASDLEENHNKKVGKLGESFVMRLKKESEMMSAASNNNNRFVVRLSVPNDPHIFSSEVLFRFDSGHASWFLSCLVSRSTSQENHLEFKLNIGTSTNRISTKIIFVCLSNKTIDFMSLNMDSCQWDI